ncbi:MAG: hypothetical protein Q8L95_00315 [Burkholderiales bacterium]|nr:hypothetical protein [Burkholderiales bacterium]
MSTANVQASSNSQIAVCSLRGAELPNVSVEYMYRDASNYKCYEIVNFSNPYRTNVSEIWRQINEMLRGVMPFPGQPIFRPEWVGLPTVFLFAKPEYQRNDDDHDWHELISVSETDNPLTLGVNSNINDFIEALQRTHSMKLKK